MYNPIYEMNGPNDQILQSLLKKLYSNQWEDKFKSFIDGLTASLCYNLPARITLKNVQKILSCGEKNL